MKKISSFIKYSAAAALLALGASACTDLTEKVYSEIPADKFYQSQDQIDGAVAAIYSNLAPFMNHGTTFSCQENSSDELMVTQKGGDWYDGGQWINCQSHQFNANDGFLNGVWQSDYKTIATCNRLIAQIPKAVTDATKSGPLVAEIRAVRAFNYYLLMDLFGNLPVYANFPATTDEFVTKDRATVFAFIESELNAVAPTLSKGKTYGKINYWAAKALLARLYLNAEVYTGKSNYAGAQAAANDIITNGPYKLESDYYNNFKTANETSTENIWVIPYDEITLTGFNMPQMTLHYASQATYNLHDQPWNGYCSIQEFYNSYDKNDKRIKNFLVGQQYAADGKTPLLDNGAESNAPNGKNLVFTPEVNELYPNAFRASGARVGKYEFKLGALNTLSNDFPLFRLGEMYLIRGEAAFRANAADPNALVDINVTAARAGLPAIAPLSLDAIYKERGREMFAEAVRRTDMIRFGKFLSPARYAQSTDGYRGARPQGKATDIVYPIPQPQLNANPSLRQNTGY